MPTAAYIAVNKLTSMEDRSSALKGIWDTLNKSRPAVNVPALTSDRNLECHDPKMCNQFLKASWKQQPIKSFFDSQVQLSIFNWDPLGKDELAKVRYEMAETQARNESSEGEEFIALIMPESLTGFGQLRSLLANWVGDSDAIFVSVVPNERSIVTRIFIEFYDLLLDRTFD